MQEVKVPLLDSKTLGPTRLGFADEKDLDAFVSTLGQFERGEIAPDAWKAFRLVNGVYSQRQEGDAMMIRVKIPQGVLTPPQLRALSHVAERFSIGRGHVTTRQNVQFHFVHLADTDDGLRVLADAGLTTREACGNSVRNVTACPYAGASALEPFDSTPYAEAVTRHLLRGPLSASLPRKFKIAFGGCCGHDCVGASFNDIGFLARVRDGKPGFRVTLGGGLSTLRRTGILAHEFAPAEDVIDVAEAVVRVFNRTGDRQHRHRARLKFVVDKLGPEEFLRQYFEERKSFPSRPVSLPQASPPRAPRNPRYRPPRSGLEEFARTNVRAQRDPDYAAVTVRLPLGDLTTAQFRALADIAEEFSEERELRVTVEQNAVLRFVRRTHLASLHTALAAADLARLGARTISDVVSCPGAYSCRLAVTQSRGMADALTTALGDRPDTLSIKISGCPNGCGQHYVAGIGLQGSVRKVAGRAVPQYHLYVGGSFGAEQAKFGRLAAKVPARRVPEAVRRLADLAAREGAPGESPDAVLARAAPERISALLADLEVLEQPAAEDFVDLGEQKAFEVQTSEGECAA
ncbi:MAG TPA: nitrite/sulfite reductase [Steroidobacteraceae bacterium]|nr:nitrite/sulfite reductase [Steroidobacteraceae bacterium]